MPIEAKASSTAERAPSPMATVATTAPTPKIIPRVVRNERSLFRSSARIATRSVSSRSSHLLLREGDGIGARRGLPAVAGDVPSRTTTTRPTKVATSGSWVTSTMVMPLAAQLLEEGHHLDAGPRIEVAGGLVGEDELAAR